MPLFFFSPLEQFIVSLCAQTGKDFSHQSDAIVLTFGLDILNELDLLIVPDFLEMSTVIIFDEPVNQASWFFVFQLSNFVTQLALLLAIVLVVGFFYSRNHFFFFPLRVLVASISAFVRDLLNENFVRFGKYFYSFFFFLFFFFLLANLSGMIPYSFAVTSHLIFTLFYSFCVFFSATYFGLFFYGVYFFNLFFPPGAPFILAPFLITIELVSYTARLFSLAIRLFANIMSGHTLLKILASFTSLLFQAGSGVLMLIPFIIISLVIGLETVIGGLQAYVFTTLTSIYLNESFYLH